MGKVMDGGLPQSVFKTIIDSLHSLNVNVSAAMRNLAEEEHASKELTDETAETIVEQFEKVNDSATTVDQAAQVVANAINDLNRELVALKSMYGEKEAAEISG